MNIYQLTLLDDKIDLAQVSRVLENAQAKTQIRPGVYLIRSADDLNAWRTHFRGIVSPTQYFMAQVQNQTVTGDVPAPVQEFFNQIGRAA